MEKNRKYGRCLSGAPLKTALLKPCLNGSGQKRALIERSSARSVVGSAGVKAAVLQMLKK